VPSARRRTGVLVLSASNDDNDGAL
jgi:hypothetical protein